MHLPTDLALSSVGFGMKEFPGVLHRRCQGGVFFHLGSLAASFSPDPSLSLFMVLA